MTKKKKILIIIATILAIAVIAFVTMLCMWKSYYNRVWQPIIDSFISAGGTEIVSTGDYRIENDNFSAYAIPPRFLKYGGNLHVSTPYEEYDESKKQYSVELYIWPKRDGTYVWDATIMEIVSYGNYRSVANAYIDPDTLKTDLPESSELNDLYEEHRETIRDLVKNAKTILGI